MDENLIRKRMYELADIIGYKFNNINLLSKAMQSVKLDITEESRGKNAKEYSNEALATVGDAILKSVLADYLYTKYENITKGTLTDKKKELENNKVLRKITIKEKIIDFAYNNIHFHDDENVADHEKVVDNDHDPYIEAIVGAVFYDSNFDITRNWVIDWLLPLLQKYQ